MIGDSGITGEKVRRWRLQSQPLKTTLCPSVYSASNLLVLLNDGILRKELRKKLPVVSILPGTEDGKHRDSGKTVTTSRCVQHMLCTVS